MYVCVCVLCVCVCECVCVCVCGVKGEGVRGRSDCDLVLLWQVGTWVGLQSSK